MTSILHGHFVLRSPLLPLETLLGAEGDIEKGRAWLRALLERPEVCEAFGIASPTLVDDLDTWKKNPNSERGRKIERALMSYAQRIASRCTPFGLFASVSLGHIGEESHLQLAPLAEARRKSRIDMGALFSIAEKVLADPTARMAARYWPNETLVRIGEELHFVQASQNKEQRAYHLTTVDADPALLAAIDSAKNGATGNELAESIGAREKEFSEEEVRAYVEQLIKEQIFVSDVRPLLTGEEAAPELARKIATLPGQKDIAATLQACVDELNAVDKGPFGVTGESRVKERMASLDIKIEPGHLVQVDLWRPANASLQASHVEPLLRHAELLFSVFARPSNPMQNARDAFTARYESAEVPFLEAIDADGGISAFSGSGDDGPLLADIPFGGADTQEEARNPALNAWLAEVLAREKDGEVVITEQELERLAKKRTLPESFSLMLTLLQSATASAFIGGHYGPSSEAFNGRFAWLDPTLEECVRSAIVAEEKLRPEALFFDIVHSPEGRVGNVIARPSLRRYELCVLGRSGAALEFQIPLSDLMLSVQNGRFVLTSKSRGCQLIPRLTNAHNTRLGFAHYRVLTQLQQEGYSGGFWQWGPLASSAYLPRVRFGKLIVAEAQWRLAKPELEKLATPADALALAAKKKWPRFARAQEGDNFLPIDLQSELSLQAFVDTYRKRPTLVVEEDLTRLFGSPVGGPGGTYANQIVVACKASERHAPALAPLQRDNVTRSFAPGSSCMFAKIYLGTQLCDQFIAGPLADLVKDALASEKLTHWFFIRYSDPDEHLRLRFFGEPEWLWGAWQKHFSEVIEELREQRLVHRVVYDTYVRETERYGGPLGIDIAERFFEADSYAVMQLLQLEHTQDERWRWTLRGQHDLLSACGLDLASELALAKKMRTSYFNEQHGGSQTEDALSAKFRPLRKELTALVFEDLAGEAGEIFRARKERLAEIAKALFAKELYGDKESIAGSLLHMFDDRMLRGSLRQQELVLFDFLSRLLQSKTAQSKTESSKTEPSQKARG